MDHLKDFVSLPQWCTVYKYCSSIIVFSHNVFQLLFREILWWIATSSFLALGYDLHHEWCYWQPPPKKLTITHLVKAEHITSHLNLRSYPLPVTRLYCSGLHKGKDHIDQFWGRGVSPVVVLEAGQHTAHLQKSDYPLWSNTVHRLSDYHQSIYCTHLTTALYLRNTAVDLSGDKNPQSQSVSKVKYNVMYHRHISSHVSWKGQ